MEKLNPQKIGILKITIINSLNKNTMYLTIIKFGGTIEQILIGKPTEQINKWAEELNNNPLQSQEVTVDQEYTDKSVYDLQQFFGIK